MRPTLVITCKPLANSLRMLAATGDLPRQMTERIGHKFSDRWFYYKQYQYFDCSSQLTLICTDAAWHRNLNEDSIYRKNDDN